MEWIFGFSPSDCARDRERLLAIETPLIEWGDLNIRAPFEILLKRVGGFSGHDTALSHTLVRPLGDEDAPYFTLGFPKRVERYRFLERPRSEGIRYWEVAVSSGGDDSQVREELASALPELLRERFWGRVLYLDESLGLWRGTIPSAKWRLYLSARGIGHWEGAGDASFWWDAPDLPRFLAEVSDEELRLFVLQGVQEEASDIGFAFQWASWGRDDKTWSKQRLASLKAGRDSPEAMRDVLKWALMCEPKFASCERLRWTVLPWGSPDERPPFYSNKGWVYRHIPKDGLLTRTDGWEEVDHLFMGEEKSPVPAFLLPPFLRRVRRWAGEWFAVEFDEEACACHRVIHEWFPEHRPPIHIELSEPLTAHERVEAWANLREFLAERTAPNELNSLLKMS